MPKGTWCHQPAGQAYCSGNDSVSVRFLALAMLSAVAVPSAARAKEVSPQVVACHDYATKKYIADFRQTGPLRISLDNEAPFVVATFQNDNPRYEDYFAECMKREIRETAQ
jgi:hypothetical protein